MPLKRFVALLIIVGLWQPIAGVMAGVLTCATPCLNKIAFGVSLGARAGILLKGKVAAKSTKSKATKKTNASKTP